MTVVFEELGGSPRKHYTRQGMRATREVLIATSDENAFITELLGNTDVGVGAADTAQFPGKSTLLVSGIRSKPHEAVPDDQAFSDIEGDLNTYTADRQPQKLHVTIEYEQEETGSREDLPDVEDGTYLTYRMDKGGEMLSRPGPALTWQDMPGQPVPDDVVPLIRVVLNVHYLSWKRVINPPWTAIREASGCVNGQVPFLGSLQESILFDGCVASREFYGYDDADSAQFGWTLDYVFRERVVLFNGIRYGWNHSYRPFPIDNPGMDRLVHRGAGATEGLYPVYDLNALFQMAVIA